jgi:hypothetical protein
MDSLIFYLGPPCPTLLRPVGGPPLTAISGVAGLQGGQPAAVFYPFGNPTRYAYGMEAIEGFDFLKDLTYRRQGFFDFDKNRDISVHATGILKIEAAPALIILELECGGQDVAQGAPRLKIHEELHRQSSQRWLGNFHGLDKSYK